MDRRLKTVELHSLLTEVCKSFESKARKQRVSIELDVPSVVHLKTNDQSIRTAIQVMIELAVNNSPSESNVLITVCEGPNGCEIEVADGGMQQTGDSGIWANASNELSFLQRFVSEHSGRLDVWPCPQGGSAIAITLPRHKQTTIQDHRRAA